MSAGLMPLTAEEIERLRTAIETLAGRPVWALNTDLLRIDVLRLCAAAESAAAQAAEIAELHQRVERLSIRHFAAIDETPLARECSDFATSLRQAAKRPSKGAAPARAFLRAADLFERASIALTELPSDVLRERAERAGADARRWQWAKSVAPDALAIIAYRIPAACVHSDPDDATDAAIAALQPPAEGGKP